MPAVEFRRVDIVFGTRIKEALALLDAGQRRDRILAETGCVLGAAGVDLTVERGQISVLMGLSGSGKSTLLRAVNRLNRVTRGAVLVEHDGQPVDVARCDDATLRQIRMRTVATVFQQFALLPWRTVRENVGLGLELAGMPAIQRKRIVDEKLAMVGLTQWAGKHAHELSGGMQQRVGLARAFATDADILLMDEPFSALDPLIRAKLQDELLVLQKRLKKTIVFVSHDLDEALKLGNRITILEGGRIVQSGGGEAILMNPADDYVAEFVRHMNPMNVLSAGAAMRPVGDLPREGDVLALDPRGEVRLALDAEGRPASVEARGVPARLGSCGHDQDAEALEAADCFTAPRTLKLRSAIALKRRTGHPILLLDEEGRLVGICGEAEIYRALLRREA